MTRLDKAKQNGMQAREATERRACPKDYDCGPTIEDADTYRWEPDMGLRGCRGIMCYKCWQEEYAE